MAGNQKGSAMDSTVIEKYGDRKSWDINAAGSRKLGSRKSSAVVSKPMDTYENPYCCDFEAVSLQIVRL